VPPKTANIEEIGRVVFFIEIEGNEVALHAQSVWEMEREP